MEKKRKAKWQNDYIAKAYDRINLTIPKGQKTAVEAFAKERGESVNGLINGLLRGVMGLSEDEWKNTSKDGEDTDVPTSNVTGE